MKRKWGRLLSGSAVMAFALILGLMPCGEAMANVTIDEFSDDQAGIVVDTAGTYGPDTAAGGMIGGYRTFDLVYTVGTSGLDDFTMIVEGGGFKFVQDPSVSTAGVCGRGSITYAGSAGTGFAPVDLTEGGLVNTLRVKNVSTDEGYDMEITVSNGTKAVSTTLTLTDNAVGQDFTVPLSSFTPAVDAAEVITAATSIVIEIPKQNGGTVNICRRDTTIDSIYIDCVLGTPPTVQFTSPVGQNPQVPWDQDTVKLCWTTTNADRTVYNGTDYPPAVSGAGCPDVGPGTYTVYAYNECTPGEGTITIGKEEPPTGACCIKTVEGENPWEDEYECLTGVTQETCEETEGYIGWSEGAENCDLLPCEAPPPPPPPVVPAFNPLGLLLFAGLIPLSWMLIGRRKK